VAAIREWRGESALDMAFYPRGMTFEQPKHLNVVIYRRLAHALQPILLVSGVILSGMMVIGLWRRAEAGEQVSAWRWMTGAAVGLLSAGLVRLALLFEKSRRRYIEFRGDGLLLAQRGVVAPCRLISWSLSPDPIEPGYTRLGMTYKFGLGRKHWTMLLDDEAQIAGLRHALTLQFPQKIIRGKRIP
jgi:hypothetical protein